MSMGRLGKLEAFRKRFEEGSVRFFEKHGARLHGFFEIGEVPPEAVAEDSAGAMVAQERTVILTPGECSPMQ